MKNLFFILFLILSQSVKSQISITANINWGCWAGENLFYVYSPSGAYLGGACNPFNCYNGASGAYSSTGITITSSTPNVCGNYFIDMYDSWGDGWNCGGSITLYVDGREIGTYSLSSGGYARVFFTIPLGYEIRQEGSTINSLASGCNNATTSLGGGSWRDINISADTYYNFTWNLSSNSNGGRIRPLNGNAGTVTGNQTNWFSGTTTSIRISTNRSSCTWTSTSSSLTYRHSQPTNVTVSGGGNNCQTATLVANGGSYGTVYWQNTTSENTNTSNPSTSQNVNSSGTYYFRSNNSGCWGNQGSASVTIQTPPTSPSSINGLDIVCIGSSNTLTALGGDEGSGSLYQWGTGTIGNNIILGESGISYTPNILSNTSYWVRRIGNTSCQNITNGSTKTISVENPPTSPTNIELFGSLYDNNLKLISSGGTNGSGSIYQWGTGTSLSNFIPGEESDTLSINLSQDDTYWVRRIGNTSCSLPTDTKSIFLDYNLILPIQLKSFNSNCEEIFWETYSEENSDYFILERSFNGIDFEKIVKIKSKSWN